MAEKPDFRHLPLFSQQLQKAEEEINTQLEKGDDDTNEEKYIQIKSFIDDLRNLFQFDFLAITTKVQSKIALYWLKVHLENKEKKSILSLSQTLNIFSNLEQTTVNCLFKSFKRFKPIIPKRNLCQCSKESWQYLERLVIVLQILIAMLIGIPVKKITTFTGRILYSFNQIIIEWLNNKFPSSSALSQLKSDSNDIHTQLCEKFPNSDFLVNLYLLGYTTVQLWGILKIAIDDLDAEDLIFKPQSVKLSYCLLSYLPEEFVSDLYYMQERWRKQQLSELTINFKTYLLILEFFMASLQIRLVG